MKLNLIISTAILFFLNGLICNATTLIVNNHFPTPAGEYATIQLAHNAASVGDTILLTPSEGTYNGIEVTKLVHIVGNGWTRPSVSVPNTKTSTFNFIAGSEGSTITGCEVNGNIIINTNNITVKRNKCNYLSVEANYTNAVIMQNSIIESTCTGTWRFSCMIYIAPNTEVFLSNNILINNGSCYTELALLVDYPSNAIICNNVVRGGSFSIYCSMDGSNYSTLSVFNNIIPGGNISGIDPDDAHNNISNSTQFGVTNGNQQNVDINTVFVDAANNNFHLKEGSPAIGSGLGGTDCGIYGGTFPFVDNGRTWLPIITEANVQGIVNKADGLDITVKAKSGN